MKPGTVNCNGNYIGSTLKACVSGGGVPLKACVGGGGAPLPLSSSVGVNGAPLKACVSGSKTNGSATLVGGAQCTRTLRLNGLTVTATLPPKSASTPADKTGELNLI